MTDYKLVPVKRCAACGNEKPVSEMKTCMHNQMHRYVCDSKCMNDFYNPPNNPRPDAVAPAVQGEPVAWLIDWPEEPELGYYFSDDPNEHARSRPLYPAPQPAEQKPFEWPKLERPAKVGAGRFDAGVSSRLVVEAAQRQYEYDATPEKEADRIARLDGFRKAILQPAPDVAALVEALEACRDELLWMIERHNQQDHTDGSWLYDYQTVVEADAALAAHRKGGES